MNDNNFKNPEYLIRLAKNGDADAFQKLYEIYFIPVFRYIYFRVKNRENAEDLVQEVFLKVYNSISKFQEKGKSPLNFFFTVARNTVIDYWRKKKTVKLDKPEEVILKIADKAVNPLEAIEKNETAKMVQEAVKHLTDEQQEVIILKFINDLSNKEIAKLLNKSEEAIRQIQCRGLKSLSKNLKDYKIL